MGKQTSTCSTLRIPLIPYQKPATSPAALNLFIPNPDEPTPAPKGSERYLDYYNDLLAQLNRKTPSGHLHLQLKWRRRETQDVETLPASPPTTASKTPQFPFPLPNPRDPAPSSQPSAALRHSIRKVVWTAGSGRLQGLVSRSHRIRPPPCSTPCRTASVKRHAGFQQQRPCLPGCIGT